MTKNHESKAHRTEILILLVLFGLSLSWVLLDENTLRTHDFWYHVIRIESMAEAFRNGVWIPRIFPNVYQGFGYATSLFYCDFFIYLPAVLTYIGVSVLTSYKIYQALLILATVLCTYYCASRMTGDKTAAVLTSFLYTGSSYFAVDLFIRGALGECQAFVFLPFVILGAYEVLYTDRRSWANLAIGFGGLVLSHNLSLILTAFFFALLVLVNAPRVFREPWRLVCIVKAAMAVVFATAYFLLPMAEQLLTEDFFAAYHASIWNPRIAAVSLKRLFFGAKLYESPFVPSLGVTMLVGFLICGIVFFAKRHDSIWKYYRAMFIGVLFSLFACTRFFPWVALDPYLNLVQFPWRFFLYATVFISFCTGIAFSLASKRFGTGWKRTALIVAVLVCCFIQFSATTAEGVKIATRQGRLIQDTSEEVMIDENYLHANNNRDKWSNREEYIDLVTGVNVPVDASMTKDYANRYIEYSGNTSENALEVSAVYFRGYKATDMDTGQELEVLPSDNGWVQIGIGNKSEGRILLAYEGTLIQLVSPYISLAFAACLIIKAVLKGKKDQG